MESSLECGKALLALLHKLSSQYQTVYNQELFHLELE